MDEIIGSEVTYGGQPIAHKVHVCPTCGQCTCTVEMIPQLTEEQITNALDNIKLI